MAAILKSIKKNISQKTPTSAFWLLWGFFALQIEIKIYKVISISIYQLVFPDPEKLFILFLFHKNLGVYKNIHTHTFCVEPKRKVFKA